MTSHTYPSADPQFEPLAAMQIPDGSRRFYTTPQTRDWAACSGVHAAQEGKQLQLKTMLSGSP